MKKASVITVVSVGTVLAGATLASAEEQSAEEVLQQSNEAMENLESFSNIIETEESTAGTEGEMDASTTLAQDVIIDPFKMRQETTIMNPDGEEETLQSYLTEEGYFQEDGEGGWILVDNDTEYMEEMAYYPHDPVAEFMSLDEEIELGEEDGYYVLTYQGDGEEFEDLFNDMDELNEEASEEEVEMVEEMLDDIELSDVYYELHIDQETHYLTNSYLELTMTLDVEGAETAIDQTIDMEFHNFDNVEDFDLPEGVLEEAESLEDIVEAEIEEEFEEGDEMADTATNQPLWTAVGFLFLFAAGGLLLAGRKTEKA
ncbi:DUF6612 family protein [Alkalicoccus daliensis]|uniref:Gram-positive cocci surface proteins LPxTG domain-containing protein n=1 Tax=Alkalicoccus daliensis TaxID=745820 RepID=A0A1H0HJP3_9BACI|nr:DUF6612 family protein [Alkalicoccus daliensis]SDO19051.1 hypothetical protein SAMN04488053_108120 [Alkalicoccus daliensis]